MTIAGRHYDTIWMDDLIQSEGRMAQTYYEYIILRRTKDDVEVVQELNYKLAKDEVSVRLQAAREIPMEFEDNLAEVEILVRPFV